jgi:hypothetical protein
MKAKRDMSVSWKKSKVEYRKFKGAIAKVLTVGQKGDLAKLKTQNDAARKKKDKLKVKIAGEIKLAKAKKEKEIREIKGDERTQVAEVTSKEAVERKEMKGVESKGEIHRKAKREVMAINEETNEKIKMAKKSFKQAKEVIKAQALV